MRTRKCKLRAHELNVCTSWNVFCIFITQSKDNIKIPPV
nr:MAG TPA: hypothetical protein [Inoviridae sp.]